MGAVCWPFHVKYKGRRYAPGETVQVEDVAAAIAQGAKAVEMPVSEEKPARKQKN